jgi:chromosomal replication initiation ATPase DnaA
MSIRSRQVAMTLCRELTKFTYEEIGRFLDRDHGSVISGVKAVRARCELEPSFDTIFAQIRHACEAQLARAHAA